mmetsp:Transcript_22277/g.32420  ORF Transcript_22277/g.32420 Transcript_22277/m.32420 type:complete len:435 (-) Transcript_22277:177-1481(-)
MEGGYRARNGAKDAPIRRSADSTEAGDDFPMLCETCLGQNPYVRMVKLPFGKKLCKISHAPYQAFRWKAGPGGRYKETVISFVIAKDRNICQACLNDMQFGLPVGVRDKLISESKGQVAMPKSEVGQMYYHEQQAQLQNSSDGVSDQAVGFNMQHMAQTNQLAKFSQAVHSQANASSTAFRNLPKLCTFWLGGGCTRVKRKACPFRPCCGTFVFPELAATHREEMQKLVEDLKTRGPDTMQRNLSPEVRDALRAALKGNKDDAIKKRVYGEDDLTSRYLGKMKAMRMELTPPSDGSVTTLWVGGVDADITADDLRDIFYAYGHLQNIHVVPASRCAFVDYGDRAAAEYAASQLYNNLTVKGRTLSLNWAKPRAQALVGGSEPTRDDNDAVLLPPGMSASDMKSILPTSASGPPPPPGPPPSYPSMDPQRMGTKF